MTSKTRAQRPALTKAGQLRMLERGFAQGRAAAPEAAPPAPADDPTGRAPSTGTPEPATPATLRPPRRTAPSPSLVPAGTSPESSAPVAATDHAPDTDASQDNAQVSAQDGAGEPTSAPPAQDAADDQVPAPDADPDAAREGASETASPNPAAAAVPQAPERGLAGPPSATDEMMRKSLNLAPTVVRAAETWLRARRDTYRRPALSWLLDAAFADLPTDVSALRELAAELPAEVLNARPQQVTGLIRRDTATRVEDAQFELAQTRRRETPLWHALSAALVRQLRAEQIPVDLDTGT